MVLCMTLFIYLHLEIWKSWPTLLCLPQAVGLYSLNVAFLVLILILSLALVLILARVLVPILVLIHNLMISLPIISGWMQSDLFWEVYLAVIRSKTRVRGLFSWPVFRPDRSSYHPIVHSISESFKKLSIILGCLPFSVNVQWRNHCTEGKSELVVLSSCSKLGDAWAHYSVSVWVLPHKDQTRGWSTASHLSGWRWFTAGECSHFSVYNSLSASVFHLHIDLPTFSVIHWDTPRLMLPCVSLPPCFSFSPWHDWSVFIY